MVASVCSGPIISTAWFNFAGGHKLQAQQSSAVARYTRRGRIGRAREVGRAMRALSLLLHPNHAQVGHAQGHRAGVLAGPFLLCRLLAPAARGASGWCGLSLTVTSHPAQQHKVAEAYAEQQHRRPLSLRASMQARAIM